MSDACDGEFFRLHVWPLLLKDVKNQIAEAGASIAPDTVLSVAEREFLSRNYKLAHLLTHPAASGPKRTAARELQLAGMQAYAFMYERTLAITRDIMDEHGMGSNKANDE